MQTKIQVLNEGIGASLPRIEDGRLLRGNGRYASDNFPNNFCHAVIVRSVHAHARIVSIDSSNAVSIHGVLKVLTGREAIADGIQPIPHNPDWQGPPDAELCLPDDFKVYVSDNPPLPPNVTRYVGEPVAIVVAETQEIANDAAERIEIEYQILPSVIDSKDALEVKAIQIWPNCLNNLALDCEVGDKTKTDQAFKTAAYTVQFTGHIHRVNGSPMEPRAVVGEYNPKAGLYTLRTASGRGAVQTRERLAVTLGVPIEKCRVVFGDMGGNFGTRNAFSPEFALIPWAAKRVGRPVKWTANRTECFLSDYQARDLHSTAELALDAEGNFIGLRGINILNLGAYSVYFWPLRKGLSMMQSVYRIPAVHFQGKAVFTNTAPTAVYRSAGRPEAVYMIERLIDLAALQYGFDRLQLRKRNLIKSNAMPFTNGVGVTYDSGNYCQTMDDVLKIADWENFHRRRAESLMRGKCRGIAVANYIEVTSGIPRERAELKVCDDDIIEFIVGTMSSGQGHETSFLQLVCEWLEIPFNKIRFIANDTSRVSIGGGSHSGRSMRLVSIALSEAIEILIEKGKTVAANILQTNSNNITYREGQFFASGDTSIGLFEAAKAAQKIETLPNLEAVGDITNRAGGYPSGAHVCEVEVDPETGQIEIVSWSGVDDVGLAINPLILHGQAHGAATQGIGQAYLEEVLYDRHSAQLTTGSFLDYAMPRADNTPPFNMLLKEIPATSHPFGIRPGGEGATTPALGLLINAIVNALGDYGVKDIAMPATPERVWRAINDSNRTNSAESP